MARTEHTSLIDLDAHRKAPPAYLKDEYIEKAPHGHGLTLKLLKTVQQGIQEISGHLRMSDAELARHKQALEAAGFLRAPPQASKPPGVSMHLDCYGEYFHGTREALQGLGLGADQAFPTDKSGRYGLLTIDPRGLPCKITAASPNDQGEATFHARITYPGRHLEIQWLHHAPGVRTTCQSFGTAYAGKAEALIAAGLVSKDQLPGAPGLPKTCARFMPDGSFTKSRVRAIAGAKEITKHGQRFEILVQISPEEEARRNTEAEAQREAWARQPRPVSLLDLAAANAMRTNGSEAKRPRLTLVLSPCAQQPMGAAGVKAQGGA